MAIFIIFYHHEKNVVHCSATRRTCFYHCEDHLVGWKIRVLWLLRTFRGTQENERMIWSVFLVEISCMSPHWGEDCDFITVRDLCAWEECWELLSSRVCTMHGARKMFFGKSQRWDISRRFFIFIPMRRIILSTSGVNKKNWTVCPILGGSNIYIYVDASIFWDGARETTLGTTTPKRQPITTTRVTRSGPLKEPLQQRMQEKPNNV